MRTDKLNLMKPGFSQTTDGSKDEEFPSSKRFKGAVHLSKFLCVFNER